MEILNQINTSRDLAYVLFRAFILYLMAVILIRMNRRVHIETSFDFVFIIIIGAVFERGIFVDSTTLVQTIGAALILILTHKLFSYTTYHSKIMGKILKGKPTILYKSNHFNKKLMESSQVTEEDIMEACRRDMQCNTLDSIKQVNLERTGKISFITD